MATPNAFGALAAPVSVAPATTGQIGPLGNFAQGLSQLPDDIQNAQLSQAMKQDQLSQLDDKRLAQIAQFAQANGQYASNPQAMKVVQDIYKRRGLPPPIVSDDVGQRLDVNALVPGKPFGQLTEQEKAYYNQLDPQRRAAEVQAARIIGAPKEFLSAPPSVALSPTEGVAMMNALRVGAANVANPNSGGPAAYAAQVRLMAPQLDKLFGPGQAEQLLNDPQLMQALEQRASIATQRYVELGIIKPEEEMKYHQQLVDIDRGKLAVDQKKAATQQQRADQENRRINGQLQRWDTQNAGLQKSLGIAQQRLTILAQSGPTGAKSLLNYGKQLTSQLNTASGQLDNLQNIARGYVTAGQDVPPDVVNRIQTLQGQINTLTPLAGAAVQQATQQFTNTLRATTGSSAIELPQGFNTQPTGPAPTGYTYTGVQRSDGAFQVKGSDGRLRYWKPE